LGSKGVTFYDLQPSESLLAFYDPEIMGKTSHIMHTLVATAFQTVSINQAANYFKVF